MHYASIVSTNCPMVGIIRGRHLLLHAPLIIRQFGWGAYLRCLAKAVRHPRSATFLRSIR